MLELEVVNDEELLMMADDLMTDVTVETPVVVMEEVEPLYTNVVVIGHTVV